MERPLLSLVMIVKNEASNIRETLESCLPAIDRYVILDTGSTDGTQDIIRDVFADLPGELHEEPFIDFGTSRNRVLDLAGTGSTFTLMLSGDETLQNPAALRAFCVEHADGGDGAYDVKIKYGETTSYASPRLARADAGWRYVGVTHEVLLKPGSPPPSIAVPDAQILHDLAGRNPDAQRRRWSLDKELLAAEVAKDPSDTRSTFYLAQSHECLGDLAQAVEFYRRRVALGGWEEEVYEAKFRIARCLDGLGAAWPEVQSAYLDAHAFAPYRAEPLHAIADYWFRQGNWPLTFLFAYRGYAIPYPRQARLFIADDVYTDKLPDLVGVSAYYVGEFAIGEAACRQLLARHPDDERLQRNLHFYEERKAREAA